MNFIIDIKEKTSLLHSATENTGYIKKIFNDKLLNIFDLESILIDETSNTN